MDKQALRGLLLTLFVNTEQLRQWMRRQGSLALIVDELPGELSSSAALVDALVAQLIAANMVVPLCDGLLLEPLFEYRRAEIGAVRAAWLEEHRANKRPKGAEASPSEGRPTRLFISYSKLSPELDKFVVEMANSLRRGGVDAMLDRYASTPLDGWPAWQAREVERADFVLCNCTSAWSAKFQGEDSADGDREASWERLLADQLLYGPTQFLHKIIVLITDGAKPSVIPETLRSCRSFSYPSGYQDLYRYLTRQPEVVPPKLGTVRGREPQETTPLEPKHVQSDGLLDSLLSGLARPRLVAKRAEVPANVDGIKTGQMGYDAAFDRFLPCGSEAEARASLTDGLRPWAGGPGWDELGWAPDGKVRGAYWVEVSSRGDDFMIHGIIDADGDGRLAHFIATKYFNATRVSPEDHF